MGFVDEAARFIIGEELDEMAIETAIETMNGMTGNAGQETIIGDHEDEFTAWAQEVLNGGGPPLSAEVLGISSDAYFGTIQIWSTGADIIYSRTSENEADEGDGEETEEVGFISAIMAWLF